MMKGEGIMDEFDRELFETLKKDYASMNIRDKNQGELYQRFLNLDHLDEAKPYIFTMRYLGIGTPEDKSVLKELKAIIGKRDYILAGLFFDLTLFEKEDNEKIFNRMKDMVRHGYSDVYLKEQSHLHIDSDEDDLLDFVEEEVEEVEELSIRSCICQTFEPAWRIPKGKQASRYYGLTFTSLNTSYISLVVFFEHPKTNIHVKTSSQILKDGRPFSQVMNKDFDLSPEDFFLETGGWGTKDGGFYEPGNYTWEITINNKETRRAAFEVVRGAIDKKGVPINKVVTCASKYMPDFNNARFAISYDASTLEYIYVLCSFKPLERGRNIQVFYKFEYLDGQEELIDGYKLWVIEPGMETFFIDYGYSTSGQWKKGLYKYTFSFENGETHEGTFNVE